MNNLIVEVHRKKEYSLFNQCKSSAGPFFVVSVKWFESWVKYLKGGSKPTRIYLHSLLDSKSLPKSNLVYKKDYVTVPKKVWDYLKATYGSDHQVECAKENIYNKEVSITSIISSRTTSPSLCKKESISSIKILVKNKSIDDMKKRLENRTSSYKPRLLSEYKSNSIESTPRTINGIVALQNIGNFCFLNTTLQCLLALTNFIKIILSLKRNTPLVVILKEFFNQAKTGICDNKSFVEYFKSEFPPGKQHDVPELFRALLDSLDKELYRPRQVQECDPWRDYQERHSKLIVSIFSGLASSKIICLSCQDKRETYEPFTLLTLQVSITLQKSIDKYLEKETINDQYFCNSCLKVTNIEKQYFLVKCPTILVIQLKRFVTIPFYRKINMNCEFPLELELPASVERTKYELKSIAVHSGNATCGHYSAICKRSGKWFMFDDSNFQEIEIDQVKAVQAYLLIYSRKV